MPASFRFEECELDVAAYVLTRAGERVRLERIPMELLILLVQNAGTLVGRTEIQALWGKDVHLEHDSAINTAVRKVRQALGDDAERPRFVETVVGKGYRFVAPVDQRVLSGGVQPSASTIPLPSVGDFPHYCLTRGKQEFLLVAGENMLGRDADAQVQVDHPSVSRRHARISIERGRAALEDLRSLHGTFVNGRRIETPTELQSGTVIGLGPIALTFLLVPASASTSPVNGEPEHRTERPS